MPLRIRLRRVGATKQPSYRLVVADARSPRDGRFVEIVGHYNPLTDPPTISIKPDRVHHWLAAGARPTEVVSRLLARAGLSVQNAHQSRVAGSNRSDSGAETVEEGGAQKS